MSELITASPIDDREVEVREGNGARRDGGRSAGSRSRSSATSRGSGRRSARAACASSRSRGSRSSRRAARSPRKRGWSSAPPRRPARRRRPARDARVHPRQPPARLPGLRQGRRVPAAGPDLPVRAGRDADDLPEDDLRQADPGLAADRARPRALHPLLPVYAVLERRRRGRPADREKPRRPLRDRDLRRGSLPRALLGERRRALPGRRADVHAVPLPGAPVGDPGRADRLRALPRRLQHPRDDARGRRQARAVAQPPGDRRRLALRQGPLQLPAPAARRTVSSSRSRAASTACSPSRGTRRSTARRHCSASPAAASSPPSRARRRPRSRTGSPCSCGGGSARTRPSSTSRRPPPSTRSGRRSRRSATPRSWSSSATRPSSTARPRSSYGSSRRGATARRS